MNADQIRSLRPALGALLETFRLCFPTVNSFAHLANYVSGLMTDLPRKSIEPIALACHTPVRTLQEFLSHLPWDDFRARTLLQHHVADHHSSDHAIGVIDSSGHRAAARRPHEQSSLAQQRDPLHLLLGQVVVENRPGRAQIGLGSER